ncbi:methyl-accepting chemotaxis protein [Herbaspirillum sp. RV1423]|uniref:methyl-accepting chemotaxis protein n=1 Tax=Herbaspirillum sp. RV1423 TaxID=1443993 RepID=UPI0004BBFC96|nr:methyl-accepting chemotaxis protein [Herbaspirillum sp. RV1423]
MKLKTRMTVGMVLVCVSFISALCVAISSMLNIRDRFEVFLLRDQATLNSVTMLYTTGLQKGQALRNIVLDPKNKAAFKNLDDSRKGFSEALATSTELTKDNAPYLQKLREIGALDQQQSLLQKKIVELLDSDREKAIKALTTEETPAWRKIREQILTLIKTKNDDVVKSKLDMDAFTKRMLILSIALGGVAALIGVGIAYWLIHNVMILLGGEPLYAVAVSQRVSDGDFSRDVNIKMTDSSSLLFSMKTMQARLIDMVSGIRSSADRISTATTEIANGNMDLSSRTEEQASSLEETASAMEELTSVVRQNAGNADQANSLALSATQVATEGGRLVKDVVETMNQIETSAKKVVDIISVIDGIAFQTNILALNAAVEAARAGEDGRGFAVVASEVRNLAQRSAVAAKEIKQLIDNSVETAEKGNKLVQQAGATMDDVVASIQRVSSIVGEISASSHEQTTGIEQVNQAIIQIDNVTQQNAALVEEAAAAAQSLQHEAHQLESLVSIFKFSEKNLSLSRGTMTVQV